MKKNKESQSEFLVNDESNINSLVESEHKENDFWGDEEVEKEKEILVSKTKEAKLKEKERKKVEKAKKPKKSKVFKKFFYGIGKEFERVTWTSKKELASNFLVIIVIVCFFAIIFTLISVGITSI